MSGATSPQYPEKRRWVNPSFSSQWMTRRLTKSTKESTGASLEDFFSVDDTPDFHDPYSDLSLFLSQKIKHEMREHGWIKKWSIKIQEALLEKLAPEFQKKFPQYRLGVAALRKTWEKIAYYTQQLEQQKEAIGEDGGLNLTFLIKENLRQYPQLSTISGFHPYQYAHQLALKISECMAVMDGIKPPMDHLSRTIWTMQRHLLSWTSLQAAKSPYDEYDQLDKMIVKMILDFTANEPYLPLSTLEGQVKESIQSLCEMPSLSSNEQLQVNISAIVAEKIYPYLSSAVPMTTEEKAALSDFIERHIQVSHSSNESIRRILSLYLLALQLPKGLSREEIVCAIDARPEVKFSQALFAFISAELILLAAKGIQDIQTVHDHIYDAYAHACKLPQLQSADVEVIEIKIWKHLSKRDHLLEKLPYKIGQRIETEVALQLIDNPKQSFSSLVHHTLHAFQKNKELANSKKPADIERKIRLWCEQSDLLCRCIRFDKELPLLQRIVKLFSELEAQGLKLTAREFVGQVCHDYLREYPALGCYSTQLFQRITILYKYAWYTLLSQEEESSIDRFIQWHKREMRALPEDKQIEILRQIFQESLPLIPCEEALKSK